jgi:hypothetical protein
MIFRLLNNYCIWGKKLKIDLFGYSLGEMKYETNSTEKHAQQNMEKIIMQRTCK